MKVDNSGTGRAGALVLAAVLALGMQATSATAQEGPAEAGAEARVEIRSSTEDAGVGVVIGRATVEAGGETGRVDAATRFHAGDVIRVASGGRLTIALADDATIAMIGPAELQLVELNPDARRVLLRQGVVSDAYMRGVALEIATPYDAALVLQNATGFARVRLGDRVLFQKLDGDLAQTFHEGRLQPLDGAWTLNVRTGELDGGVLANAAGARGRSGMRRMVLGDRLISWGPPEDFELEQVDGKTKFTYVGDDYGVVKVGPNSTLFFLSTDESITFDENGYVVQFDGISHVYHPLFGPLPDYDEPVENSADASVSNPGRR